MTTPVTGKLFSEFKLVTHNVTFLFICAEANWEATESLFTLWRALSPAGWDISSRNIAEACEEAKVKMNAQTKVKPFCMYVKAILIVDMVV